MTLTPVMSRRTLTWCVRWQPLGSERECRSARPGQSVRTIQKEGIAAKTKSAIVRVMRYVSSELGYSRVQHTFITYLLLIIANLFRTRRRDLCITTDSNGCKSKKCIPMNSTITCSTDIRNQPVCSSSGVTYKSECEAFVNQDYNMKYLRACDDSACQNTNKGQGFCGFDNNTYADLCELEMTTGDTKRDYNGSCVRRDDKGRNKCDKIPEECRFATRSSDSACPIAGKLK